eukprot:TRINITY_DN16887_c0_g1_i1.p1 TRINITY_DN16887_c0_g1~~TRINITY_DN16887_c0_g1_i1.p1  ORF type:complete len:224 (-),score=66.35 TRINITY_DN16887_c0_g1_i1:55-726(-)
MNSIQDINNKKMIYKRIYKEIKKSDLIKKLNKKNNLKKAKNEEEIYSTRINMNTMHQNNIINQGGMDLNDSLRNQTSNESLENKCEENILQENENFKNEFINCNDNISSINSPNQITTNLPTLFPNTNTGMGNTKDTNTKLKYDIIVINIDAKNGCLMKMKVKTTVKISTIKETVAKSLRIDPKLIHALCDKEGHRLEPNFTISQCEIRDGEEIKVHYGQLEN